MKLRYMEKIANRLECIENKMSEQLVHNVRKNRKRKLLGWKKCKLLMRGRYKPEMGILPVDMK